MKLGEFFVQLGVKGSTDELNKTLKQLEEAQEKSKALIKYRKDLAGASTEEEKNLIKKNFAQKVEIMNTKKAISGVKSHNMALMGTVKAIGAFVGASVLAYKAVDRMINSFAAANQQLINFQRQTGLSFTSLNKYASAAAATNYNATIQGTAQTMQRLSQNLYDIRMGRGDISPYQELAFVGGKAFNPMGLSVEELIENVREAIKGVDDVQATNIITRMGFSPDDITMLRMSREEFEQINSLFLDGKAREAMNKYALQLKIVKLNLDLIKDKALLKLMPMFIKLSSAIRDSVNIWADLGRNIINFVSASQGAQVAVKGIALALAGLFVYFHPLLALLTGLYLLIEDIAAYFLGYDSLTGRAIEGIKKFVNGLKEIQVPEGIKKLGEALNNIKPPQWMVSFGEAVKNMIPQYNVDTSDNPMTANTMPEPINTNNTAINNNTSNNTFNQNNNIRISTNQDVTHKTAEKIGELAGIMAQNRAVV